MCSFRLISFASLLAAASPLAAQQRITVIGDSLSKEYRVTFPGIDSISGLEGIDPTNPGARNWAETLAIHRQAHCDLGEWRNRLIFEYWNDLRFLGHEYNWAVPGFTSRQMRDAILLQNTDEVTNDPVIGELLNAIGWQNTAPRLLNQLPSTAATVIWLGGNDVRFGNQDPSASVGGVKIGYNSIYTGNGTGAGDPAPLMNSIETSLRQTVNTLRTRRPDLPLVICAVPHVGCTPSVRETWPYDPVRTGRITAALDGLNARLRSWTENELNAAWVDTYSLTTQLLDGSHMNIGGVTFYNAVDTEPTCSGTDALPAGACTARHSRFLFAHDGFHPTNSLQAKVAQMVLHALRAKYPDKFGTAQELGDREIIKNVLGISATTGFTEFMDATGLSASQKAADADPDNDGLKNIAEFALAGNDPVRGAPIQPQPGISGGQFTLTWKPRFSQNAGASIVCQQSVSLGTWTDLPADQVTENPDGSITAAVAPSGGDSFLRLKITLTP